MSNKISSINKNKKNIKKDTKKDKDKDKDQNKSKNQSLIFNILSNIVLSVISLIIYFIVIRIIIVVSLTFIETIMISEAIDYDPVVFVIFVSSTATVFITLFITKVNVFKLLKKGIIRVKNYVQLKMNKK